MAPMVLMIMFVNRVQPDGEFVFVKARMRISNIERGWKNSIQAVA